MALTQHFFHPKYQSAAKLFEQYAATDEEAQLVVYVGGELVIDLAANTSPNSLTTVYSVSKGLAAIAMAKLVDDGRLDLDQTVAHYWPEFAAKGKENVTVRQLLSHQAGLPETDEPLTPEQFLDDHAAAEALAAQRPFWNPGAGHGYHGLTIGPLMSELCFRITGQTIQAFYEANVRSQAGTDAYLGLPAELEPRVLELQEMRPPTPEQLAEFAPPKRWSPSPIGMHVFGRGLGDFILTPEGRRFGLASAGGVASARGLAGVFNWATGYRGALGQSQPAGGIGAETLDRFSQLQAYGLDLVLDQPTRAYGVVFMKPHPMMPFGSHRAFGHDGAAGAFVMADPMGEIVVGYTIRRNYFPGGMDQRLQPILDELRKLALTTSSVGDAPAGKSQARISG